jgi:ribulose-phosphate 3-epimerase
MIEWSPRRCLEPPNFVARPLLQEPVTCGPIVHLSMSSNVLPSTSVRSISTCRQKTHGPFSVLLSLMEGQTDGTENLMTDLMRLRRATEHKNEVDCRNRQARHTTCCRKPCNGDLHLGASPPENEELILLTEGGSCHIQGASPPTSMERATTAGSFLNTSGWQDLPHTRLLADVSLWSADLANLAAGIERVEEFADSFHLDVSDAHFTPSLLFFPDLIRALRPLTKRPLHIHLMVERPTTIIEDFVASGADVITIHAEVGKSEAAAAIQTILHAGRSAGLALRLDSPVAVSEPYLDRIDALLLLGTVLGVKGQDLAPEACDRLASAAFMLGERRARVRLIADGGIRSHTVPLLRRAGADVIVPGSLVFQSQNLVETFSWLRAL